MVGAAWFCKLTEGVVVIVIVVEALDEALVDGGGLGSLAFALGLGFLLLFLESRLFGRCMELGLDIGEACWGLVCGHCCRSLGELQEVYGGRRFDMASRFE